MKNRAYFFIGVFCTLLALFLIGVKVYKDYQREKLAFMANDNFEIFVPKHAPRIGSAEAKVFLIEFLDPECESCRAFYPVVKSILKDFGNKVQLVIRYAPFHKNSTIAIKALEAAREQQRYHEALELLFFYQPQWGDHQNPQVQKIFGFIENAGFDMQKLNKDMKNPRIQKIIDHDIEDLKLLGVKQTPTFFVNGRKLETFSESALRGLINDEMAKFYD